MNFFILTLIKAAVVAFVMLTTLAYLQWIERKLLAHIQLRLGPSRVGPHGLLQPLADVIKLMTKEDLVPAHVNKFFYILAPFLAVALALIPIAVIPFGPKVEIFGVETLMGLADLNIGILFVLAVSSVGVYGVALGGWASNNKYSLLGALRSSAQMISYELPMALALAAPLLIANTLNFRELVGQQGGYWWGVIPQWYVVMQPLAFVLYVIAVFAETNRIPFDLPEAENELVAGYHTEYSSMKFAGFFMAEYANMITVTAVATLLFLGGWHPLWPIEYGSWLVPVLLFLGGGVIAIYHGLNPARRLDRITLPIVGIVFCGVGLLFAIPLLQPFLLPSFWFAGKTGLLLFIFIWVRGTLPRFRYDQLMRLAWTFMFPVAILNLLVTSLVVALT